MKFVTVFILTSISWQACFGQTEDTIRVYVHEKLTDSWKLEVKNNRTYSLYNNLVTRDDFTTKGECIITDRTFQFLCDTSKLKNKNFAKDRLKQFSNIPFILTGDTFARCNNFFIPHNINYEPECCITMPTGIFARYYLGDGFGSCIIELKQDNTYIFYDNSCMAHFTEKGTWSLKNDIVTFIPPSKKRSMLDWVTKDRKLYLTETYLVGKKTAKTYTKTRKPIVTETYSYLSKEPIYGVD